MAAIQTHELPQESEPVSARPGDPEFYRGDDYCVSESIGYLLRQLRINMDRAIDAEMAELDLTGVQWGPMLMIDFGLGDTAAELARFGCVDTGAMTRMLDRLEAKRLLRRARCAKDRRVVRLELTDEGKRLCRKIPYNLSRVLNGMLRGFSAEEVETFKALTRRMLANAEAR
ncbi:MAG: MarR family transcriptional regulator [Betaproteobacteria bacterium]